MTNHAAQLAIIKHVTRQESRSSAGNCQADEPYICYNLWTNIDTLLLTKIYSLYWNALFALCSFMGFAKNTMSCIHRYSVIQNSFTAIKIPCAPSIHPSPFPLNPRNHWFLKTVPIILLFPECHIIGIMLHIAFSDWFASFRVKN